MNKTLTLTFILFLSIVFIISCSKDSGGGSGGGGNMLNCNTITNKSFAADINPIIQATCNVASCHAAGSVNGPGPLTNHTQIAAAATTIRSAVASGLMPQGSTLTTAQKNSILCWIDNGALNN